METAQPSENLFSLQGKVALVTGGSQGIGLMIAAGLLRAGAKVYISSRKASACEAAATELSAHGPCIALPADLSTEAGVTSLADRLREREEQLHVLVNNAGATWGASLETYPDSAWDKVLALNVKSVFFMSRAFLPELKRAARANDPARIINIGSIHGLRVPDADNYAYSTSKAAVHHLTRILAQRLAGEGIAVNAVAPGPFPSRMMASELELHGDEYLRLCPFGRLGEPDDIAGALVYLASRASAYVTGQVLAVDGGISTAP